MIVFKVFYQDFYQIYLIVTATFIMFWNQTFTWVLFMGGWGMWCILLFVFSGNSTPKHCKDCHTLLCNYKQLKVVILSSWNLTS